MACTDSVCAQISCRRRENVLTGHVVDAHHHLWDPVRRYYPWMDGEAFAPIRRTYSLPELDAVTSASGVGATVLVQAVSDLAESAEFSPSAESAGSSSRASSNGSTCPSAKQRSRSRSTNCAPDSGGERLVGIRHQVEDEAQRNWLVRDDVVAAIAKVGAAGLVYDMLVLTDQLRSAVDLAALDTMTFVLDHAAKPPFTGGPDDWNVWKSGSRGARRSAQRGVQAFRA